MSRVTILCGISGAGKSTIAEQIGCEVCSADKFFMDDDGNYKFNPRFLSDVHTACLREYVELVRGGKHSDVVVDNTNTTLSEIAPYAALALAYGWELLIRIVKCDVETAFARNVHGVPRETIEKQASRLSRLKDSLPPWWPVECVTAENIRKG
jgi:predicted kinase